MSGFSASWLALREPADAAARSTAMTDVAVGALLHLREPLVVDLGSGTGSNVRYLSKRLPDSRWRLVDNDDALLAVATRTLSQRVDVHAVDLRVLNQAALAGAALVTASALLDLVSEAWLASLVAMTRQEGCAVLWALNYDGRIGCLPADTDDELVRSLVNRHQQTDKGLGPALGPHAGARADSLLRAAGYHVRRAPSDWQLGPDQSELQRQLIDGWAQAASELEPERADAIEAWRMRRQTHVTAGVSHIIVGHDDVVATL